MTSLRNMAVSDSAVYRGIYRRRPMEDPLQLESVRRRRGGAAEEEAAMETMEAMETSKWAFLKRLLEIEEAHDKRRRARERQERALNQASLRPVAPSDKMLLPLPDTVEVDHSAKWLSGQVLTTAAPDTDNTETSSSRFPPVCGHLTPTVSTSCQDLDLVRARDNHASSSSSMVNQLALFATAESRAHKDSYQRGLWNFQQHGPILKLKTSSHPTSDGDHFPYSLSSSSDTLVSPSDDNDSHASLSQFQRVPSRLTSSASKKHRQLRLPPILLPRVYSVQPRPLKALEFPTPTKVPEPITETQWEDLHDCRYIRHITPRRSLNL